MWYNAIYFNVVRHPLAEPSPWNHLLLCLQKKHFWVCHWW